MSTKVEWMDAKSGALSLAPAGREIGDDAVSEGNVALVVEADEVAVFEGPPAVLRRKLAAVLRQLDAWHPENVPAPKPIGVLVIRDPDSSDDVEVFGHGGAAVETVTVCVDPGHGYSISDWTDNRQDALTRAAAVSPAFVNEVGAAYDAGAESKYVVDDQLV